MNSGARRPSAKSLRTISRRNAAEKKSALTVEEVRNALATCRPDLVHRGVCGWDSRNVTADVLEEATRKSPPEDTAFVVLHPDGVDCGELGKLRSGPPVKLLWVVVGDSFKAPRS